VNWNPLLLRSAAVLAIGLPIAAIPASADPAAQQPSADKVHELVARLSDDDWKARDKAQEQLAAMGEAAEGPLRERLREPKLDAEERSRVEAVLQKLEAARQSGPSRVTFRKSAAAPAEVLAAITQQTKVAFAPGTDNLLADAKPFDADFTAAPLWQAVLEVSSKTGLTFHSLNKDGQVVLQPATTDIPTAPAAAAGPFLVTLSRVEVNISRGRDFAGQKPMNARNNDFQSPPCQLYLFAWGEPRLKPIRWFVDSIEECVTDNGAKLEPRRGWGEGGSVTGGRVNGLGETQLTLLGNLEGAKRIERLRVRARFVLQRQTQKLELGDVLTLRNSRQLVGGFPVEIVQVNKVVDGQYAYELLAKRGGKSQAEWELFKALLDHHPVRLQDAKGTALGFSGGGASYGPDEVRITNNVRCEPLGGGGKAAGEPVTLVWEFPSEVEQVSVPLEFRDVPLP